MRLPEVRFGNGHALVPRVGVHQKASGLVSPFLTALLINPNVIDVQIGREIWCPGR